MSGSTAAFFDVDGTLVDSDIVRYGIAIRTAGMPGPVKLLWMAGFLPRVPYYLALDRRSRSAFQRAFYRIYRGLSREALTQRTEALFHEHIAPRIFPAAATRVAEHRRKGHRVVLVSGSIEPIVRPLADHLGVKDVLAPCLEAVNGHCTGELAGPPLAGERKAEAVLAYARQNGIDPEASFAYADGFDDLALLEAVGRPVAVNPEPRLFAVARQRGWDVFRWKDLARPGSVAQG